MNVINYVRPVLYTWVLWCRCGASRAGAASDGWRRSLGAENLSLYWRRHQVREKHWSQLWAMGRQAAVGSVCVVVGGWAHEYILLLLLLVVVVVVCVCVLVCACMHVYTSMFCVCLCETTQVCVVCAYVCVCACPHVCVCVAFCAFFFFLRGLQVYKLYIRVHMLLHVYQGG